MKNIHSVPVPQLYKRASKIVKAVVEEHASLKQLLYDDKNKHLNTNALNALTSKALKHNDDARGLLHDSGMAEENPRMDPWLMQVLVTELIWGKRRLPGENECVPIQTVLRYEAKLKEHAVKRNVTKGKNVDRVVMPRYVRINTIKQPVHRVIQEFVEEGWQLMPTPDDYRVFLKVVVTELVKPYFIQDFHLKDLLVFPPESKFHGSSAYLETRIFLQDKASCLPPYLLNPPPGSVVLDMCAAPGLKTTQLAAIMQNKGSLIAVDKDEKRHGMLEQFVEKSGATCVITKCANVKYIGPSQCSHNVEYILLDPSCSASGVQNRHVYEILHQKPDKNRVKNLAAVQATLLTHAVENFPKAKRIVYSTCSHNEEENEGVIDTVIRTAATNFRVVDYSAMLPDWINYGSTKYEFGTKCFYSRSEVDKSNTFFIAVLERDLSVHVDVDKLERKREQQSFMEKEEIKVMNLSVEPDIEKLNLTQHNKDSQEMQRNRSPIVVWGQSNGDNRNQKYKTVCNEPSVLVNCVKSTEPLNSLKTKTRRRRKRKLKNLLSDSVVKRNKRRKKNKTVTSETKQQQQGKAIKAGEIKETQVEVKKNVGEANQLQNVKNARAGQTYEKTEKINVNNESTMKLAVKRKRDETCDSMIPSKKNRRRRNRHAGNAVLTSNEGNKKEVVISTVMNTNNEEKIGRKKRKQIERVEGTVNATMNTKDKKKDRKQKVK